MNLVIGISAVFSIFIASCSAADGSNLCQLMQKLRINVCARPLMPALCPSLVNANCQNQQPTTKRPSNECKTDACLDAEMRRCCEANGVKPGCMKYCKYSYTDANELACKTECVEEIKRWFHCAANGKKNWGCCRSKGITNADCRPFCDGSAPPVNTMFGGLGALQKYFVGCLQKGETVMQCHKENTPGKKNWETKNWGAAEPFPIATKPFADQFCSQQG